MRKSTRCFVDYAAQLVLLLMATIYRNPHQQRLACCTLPARLAVGLVTRACTPPAFLPWSLRNRRQLPCPLLRKPQVERIEVGLGLSRLGLDLMRQIFHLTMTLRAFSNVWRKRWRKTQAKQRPHTGAANSPSIRAGRSSGWETCFPAGSRAPWRSRFSGESSRQAAAGCHAGQAQ